MKTGLVSITFREHSLEGLVVLVTDVGLSGVEWGGDVHAPHGDLATASRAKRLCEESGLEISAYGSYYRFDDCLEEGVGDGPEFEAVLDTAEAMGAPSIRVWAGRRASADVGEINFQRIVSRSREIGELASERGIRIDYEYHDNSLTDTHEATERLLDAVDHPNVRTLWQTPLQVGHAYRLEGITRLANRISNVHCNYFAENGWPDALELSEGADEWGEYLQVLLDSAADRWISIEHVKAGSVEQFKRDVATLQRWLSRLSGRGEP